MLNYIFYLGCIFIVLINISQNLSAEDGILECTLPNGRRSRCERIHHCNDIWDFIRNNGDTIQSRELVKTHSCATAPSHVCCPNWVESDEDSASHGAKNLEKDILFSLPKEKTKVNTPALHPNVRFVNNKNCGISWNRNDDEFDIEDAPWMVQLTYDDSSIGTNLTCSGVLISELYVITAASCIHATIQLTSLHFGEQKLQVRFDCDDYPNSEDCKSTIQDIGISKYTVHERYDSIRHLNDIALIKLSEPVDLRKKNVRTICLPIPDELLDAEPQALTVTGWRKSDSDKLYQTHSDRISNDACKQFYYKTKYNYNIDDSVICMNNINSETCDMIAGGPLSDVEQLNGIYRSILYGISSSRVECQDNSDVSYPDTYTDITQFIIWILDKME